MKTYSVYYLPTARSRQPRKATLTVADEFTAKKFLYYMFAHPKNQAVLINGHEENKEEEKESWII